MTTHATNRACDRAVIRTTFGVSAISPQLMDPMRHFNARILVLALAPGILSILVACNPPGNASGATPSPSSPAVAPAPLAPDETPPTETPPAETPPPATTPTETAQASGPAHASLWVSWDEGAAIAEASGRGMMVFVYTDWCARCRELEPVFETTEIREAASSLVRVRYDSDRREAWLRDTFGDAETYVPRVFFVGPDGRRLDLVSPHPQYPFFYTADMSAALLRNIRAAGGS